MNGSYTAGKAMVQRSLVKLSLSLALTLAGLFLLPLWVAGQSNPRELLKQYVAELQRSPNDQALRERIIKLALQIKPSPAIPPEVDRYEGRAEFAFKDAKSETNYLEAAKEYEKALLIAPWVANLYFNQGVAYEKAGKSQEAKRSFEFYLLAAPDAQDARDVRKRIAGLEFAIEKAARESSPEAQAAKQKKEFEEFLRSLNGGLWVWEQGTGDYGRRDEIRIVGRELIARVIDKHGKRPYEISYLPRFTLQDRNFDFVYGNGGRMKGVVSTDGRIITVTWRDGEPQTFVRQ